MIDSKIKLIIFVEFIPCLILIILFTVTYFLNKKEIEKDRKKREIDEISQAVSFMSSSDAKKRALSGNLKIFLGYGAYFVAVIPIIVLLLGKIHRGPNIPYLVFLAATGIPWLVCFVQSLMRAEKHRVRLRATNILLKPPSVLRIGGIVFTSLLLLELIRDLLWFSNKYLG